VKYAVFVNSETENQNVFIFKKSPLTKNREQCCQISTMRSAK